MEITLEMAVELAAIWNESAPAWWQSRNRLAELRSNPDFDAEAWLETNPEPQNPLRMMTKVDEESAKWVYENMGSLAWKEPSEVPTLSAGVILFRWEETMPYRQGSYKIYRF